MTVTSVGYGDIHAAAFNVSEQIVAVVIMLLTGMLWGYLIGIFCTLAAVSPTVGAFRREMSDLNNFMKIHHVDNQMRFRESILYRTHLASPLKIVSCSLLPLTHLTLLLVSMDASTGLREYMHQTLLLKQSEAQKHLMSKLSPAMQGEMALLVNERTMSRIWYLKDIEIGLLIHISSKLTPSIFPPTEFCPSGFLYVIERGLVIYLGKTRHQGSIWGEDTLLNDPELQLDFPAVAIAYTWVLTISGRALSDAINEFPAEKKKLDLIRRKWAIRRSVVRAAEQMAHEMGYNFRGRMYPIYAKSLAKRMKAERHEKDFQRSMMKLGSAGEGQKSQNPFLLARMSRRRGSSSIESPDNAPAEKSTRRSVAAPTQADAVKEKVRRATMLVAAAEYGMKVRHDLMVNASSYSPRSRPMSTNVTARTSTLRQTSIGRDAGTGTGADTGTGVGAAAVNVRYLQDNVEQLQSQVSKLQSDVTLVLKKKSRGVNAEQVGEQVQASVQATVVAMLPEIAAAVAAEVAKSKVARMRSLRDGSSHSRTKPGRVVQRGVTAANILYGSTSTGAGTVLGASAQSQISQEETVMQVPVAVPTAQASLGELAGPPNARACTVPSVTAAALQPPGRDPLNGSLDHLLSA
jgi:hypothetical protein